jgi:hypothetical protein
MASWREREVHNETRSRDRNEWIESTSAGFDLDPAVERYVCECSDRGCTSIITLSHDEYESVRAESTHFAIAIDHENPEVDRVVSENERFAVVDKFLEAARRLTRQTDPRR